jgi:hypothetical protein
VKVATNVACATHLSFELDRHLRVINGDSYEVIAK